MQTHSKELQQVVDIVVSHQALQLKCGLVVRLLCALVTPRPEHYRPLLRRLAALVGKHDHDCIAPHLFDSTAVRQCADGHLWESKTCSVSELLARSGCLSWRAQ